MCGFTGYFSRTFDFESKSFANANNIIKHRGPDDFGYITIDKQGEIHIWKNENLYDFQTGLTFGALGFRRLAILDLSENGHQPMKDITGRYWIVFNGEIYNYIELKQDLIKKGYHFRSNSDTEVIIYSYIEWGEKCIDKFNGMWAFSIYDRIKNELFCAVDHFGIKPFYYQCNSDRMIFASEIKQLLQLSGEKTQNNALIFDFLAFATYGNYDENTYFNEIKRLEPGHFLKFNLNTFQLTISRFWSLDKIEQIGLQNETSIYNRLQELLFDSVKLRLRSDVPVGTAFSGGLDSSGLVCIINELMKGDKSKNKVFTMVSNKKEIQDPYYANLLINKIPVTSYISNFSLGNSLMDLSEFIWHQEEPLQNTSIYASWNLYHFIRNNGVKVVIDGQGADEFLGGYYGFPFKAYFQDLLKHRLWHSYFTQSSILSINYNVNRVKLQLQLFLALAVNLIKSNRSSYYKYKIKPLYQFIDEDFFNKFFSASPLIKQDFLEEFKYSESIMKRDSYILARFTNLPGILRQVDRNSMAASIEARVPFLDHRLVEFLFSLPFTSMFKNGYTKYAYRMAMNGIIPNEILWRKSKEGFKMPEYEILADNKDYVLSVFEENKMDDILSVNKLKDLFIASLRDKSNYNNIIWRSINYLIWKKVFFS